MNLRALVIVTAILYNSDEVFLLGTYNTGPSFMLRLLIVTHVRE